MFDIDKYLNELRITEFFPQDTLIKNTKDKCKEFLARNKKTKSAKFKKLTMIALPAAALLLLGVFVGAAFFGAKRANAPLTAAYYTVDINPSICINVDSNETVTSIESQNSDAAKMISQIDCVGLPAIDAIKQIVLLAENEGYLNDGENFVLVGRFGSGGQETEILIADLQAQLESNLGDMIKLLVVSGTMEDKQNADQLDVSAGLLKLSKMANGVEITGEEKVGDIVEEINQINYHAPKLSGRDKDDSIKLTWTKLDFDAMGFVGDITYRIVAGDTTEEVLGGTAPALTSFTFNSSESQPREYVVKSASVDYGETKYYAIYALFNKDTVIISNKVRLTMPKPQEEDQDEDNKTPEPSKTPAGYNVSGRISGEYVKLSWDTETSSNFSGYKIVASQTNANPKYPDDGYIKFITDKNDDGISLYEGYGGLKANKYYYFSVTYLFSDGSKIAANSVRLKVPEKNDSQSDPKPTEGEDAAMTTAAISGALGETKVNLSWNKIDHELFRGYKVVASKSNPNPIYPEDGYLKYITNADTTTYSSSFSNFDEGETYYFSITVLYRDGTKKAGSVVALLIPEGSSLEEPYVSTNINGGIDGNTVSLSWGQVDHGEVEGYKVMYSFTDTTPVYQESGCTYKYWITDASKTSCSVDITSLNGYVSGETCYFSISVLYDSHSVIKAGNAIPITAP